MSTSHSDSDNEVVSTDTKVETEFVTVGNNSVKKITSTTSTKKIFSDVNTTNTFTKTVVMSTSSQTASTTSTSTILPSIMNTFGEHRLRAKSQSSSSSSESDGSSSSDDDDDGEGFSKFQRQALTSHNNYRKKHGAPPLKLNKKMCEFSQIWANTVASKGRLEHSKGSGYGENVYFKSGNVGNGKIPVDSWYSEIEKYKFGNSSSQPGTGHFSQVVWKESSELGIAKSTGGDGTYVVANYNPPGNMQGQYNQNVFPTQ